MAAYITKRAQQALFANSADIQKMTRSIALDCIGQIAEMKQKLTLTVRGFNPARNVIEDVGDAVELLTDTRIWTR